MPSERPITVTQHSLLFSGQRATRVTAKWLSAAWILTCAWNANAQTWAGSRQRPSLWEIATVDQTGEVGWLWGREDVAGNGLDEFPPAEQAIDARSVYLRFDGTRLWWRTYVSAAEAPGTNLTAYLFVDADRNPGTGLSASATDIDPIFSTDPSTGGYEYVVAVRGNGTLPQLWQLNTQGTLFVPVTVNANQLDGEANVTLDPLRVGTAQHGYVQASIVDNLIGVSGQCQARFYVRTTNQTQALGQGDLDVGQVVECAPVDVNVNQVPDVIEPTAQCQTDDQCPNGGICWNGQCWLAPVCTDDTECAATERCENGTCVFVGGTACRTDAECASVLCVRSECVGCTADADCGTGRVCGPDHACVNRNVAGPSAGGTGSTTTNGAGNQLAGNSGIVLGPGERIQGGACACRVTSSSRHAQVVAWLVLGAGLVVWHLRRRRFEGGR